MSVESTRNRVASTAGDHLTENILVFGRQNSRIVTGTIAGDSSVDSEREDRSSNLMTEP